MYVITVGIYIPVLTSLTNNIVQKIKYYNFGWTLIFLLSTLIRLSRKLISGLLQVYIIIIIEI